MRAIAFLFVLLFLISGVSALCEEGQIDINTATAEELDKIIHIGPATADEIINYRAKKLFESIDELINVTYIGEVKLAKIKEEGLACVNGAEKIGTEISDAENKTQSQTQIQTTQTSAENPEPEPKQKETINLNPQVIKTEENRNLNKSYALYGFIAFCILLGFLFIIRKNRYKNEFR